MGSSFIDSLPDKNRKKGLLDRILPGPPIVPPGQDVEIDEKTANLLSPETMDQLRVMMIMGGEHGSRLREIVKKVFPEEALQIDTEVLGEEASRFHQKPEQQGEATRKGLDGSSFAKSKSGEGEPQQRGGKPHPRYMRNPVKQP